MAQQRRAVITKPYLARTGRMVVSHLVPVIAPDGQYQGHVIGTLYLYQTNELRSMLSDHYVMDSSYTYTLDAEGNVILHTDSAWVAQPASHQEMVEALMSTEHGKMTIRGTQGQLLLAGFLLDIDHFKRVNDTLGHESGDAIIRMMADRMRSAARSGDITARSGGEEFVILLSNTTAAEAWHIAEQLLSANATGTSHYICPTLCHRKSRVSSWPTHLSYPRGTQEHTCPFIG